MPSNTAASMFGGAGGRGSRASVASLQGLRNVLRNEPDGDAAPATSAAPPAPASPAAAPAAPADDKQTLRGLNDRLSGYLDRVKQLKEENDNLEKQIDEILAKKRTTEGRDWDETEKPLDELKNKIKDIALDNAKLLLQIDNTKLANDDFKNKEDDEKKARKELENDLEVLKKAAEESKRNCEQTKKEMDLVKEELARIKREHKDDVDALRDKIRESQVTVEVDSQNSNLGQILNRIRGQYDKVAQKNLKETDEWYQSKFENIKVVESQNVEVLHSVKTEIKEQLKQKQILEIRIQTLQSTVRNLEESLRITQTEYGRRLSPLNGAIMDRAAELEKVRSQVEHKVETNRNLLCVKMKLESEINNYQQLILGMTADTESPPNKSTPPEDDPAEAVEEGNPIKAEEKRRHQKEEKQEQI
ncbi:putative keratin type I cytoskeletal 18-like [Scophthalmus maximus]|uniref:Putative keratin type I cytoskeletal 18-like n=1 Tax=Scophthalmus maximus TaxID=52904 RepID=A0A2U9AWS5_SCOMX|nr:keratin, type I cytoskeletal 18 isoform X2 [Scophthalmus maximus]AWO96025.1 putative keratin type I cytoskeletal 18-like [Scophthalmus maximus]